MTLNKAFANTAPVTAAELSLPVDIAALRDIVQRLINEVRIDRRRAVADQAGEVMRVARNARLDDDVRVATQTEASNEVVMHGTSCQQRVYRQFALFKVTVAEYQNELAVMRTAFSAVADLIERFGQR